MRLKDQSIRRKFYILLVVFLLFTSGVTIAGLTGMMETRKSSERIHERLSGELQTLMELRLHMERARLLALSMASERDKGRLAMYEKELRGETRTVDKKMDLIISSGIFEVDVVEVAKTLRPAWDEFKATRDRQILPALRSGKREEAAGLLMGVQLERFRKMDGVMDMLVRHESAEGEDELRRIEGIFSGSVNAYIILSFAGFIVSALLIHYISKDVRERVKTVQEGIKAVEEGRLSMTIGEEGRDEIGSLAKGFNRMARRLYEGRVFEEQYLNILEYDAREMEKKTGELEGAQADLTAKNRELEESVRALREANEKLSNARGQMIQSEKMASLGQLAAGVAHEINNPVGFVSSNMNTLADYVSDFTRLFALYEEIDSMLREGRFEDARKLSEGVRDIKGESGFEFELYDFDNIVKESRDGIERILSIVKALKEFSHSDGSAMTECDINHAVESVLKIIWNEVKYSAEVVKEYGELPKVLCRPQQIGQVFLNIIMNASQAMDGKGRITIRTYAEGGEAVVEISDNGAGMTADVLKRVFDPFFTTKPAGKGSGLGLSIAYGIVKDHRGSIEVKSRPGEGATFAVRLPLKGTNAREAA